MKTRYYTILAALIYIGLFTGYGIYGYFLIKPVSFIILVGIGYAAGFLIEKINSIRAAQITNK